MRTYSLNPKQALTIDAPIRNFTVEQGSVVVSKHDEVIPTHVAEGEAFAADDRGGLDLFSAESATLSVLFTDEAQLGESARHPGENEERGRKRRKRKPAAKKKAAPRGDSGGGDSGGFESRTVDQLRAEAGKRKIAGRSKMDKAALIAALRAEG